MPVHAVVWTAVSGMIRTRRVGLAHGPGKRMLIFPCDKRRRRLCGMIMLKQRDEIMIRNHLVGS
jgi:hypothetical protein